MVKGRAQRATIGVVQQGSAAWLVTVGPGPAFIDRRCIVLLESGVPTHPHHHQGSWAIGRYLKTPGARPLSLEEAVGLVERVRERAAAGARKGLERLLAEVPIPIAAIAIRSCPELPPTTEERITDHRAQTMADGVMYRMALAGAAEQLGWPVGWYDRERVLQEAAAALGRKDLKATLATMGQSAGPPWRADQKLAAAAALAAT